MVKPKVYKQKLERKISAVNNILAKPNNSWSENYWKLIKHQLEVRKART